REAAKRASESSQRAPEPQRLGLASVSPNLPAAAGGAPAGTPPRPAPTGRGGAPARTPATPALDRQCRQQLPERLEPTIPVAWGRRYRVCAEARFAVPFNEPQLEPAETSLEGWHCVERDRHRRGDGHGLEPAERLSDLLGIHGSRRGRSPRRKHRAGRIVQPLHPRADLRSVEHRVDPAGPGSLTAT